MRISLHTKCLGHFPFVLVMLLFFTALGGASWPEWTGLGPTKYCKKYWLGVYVNPLKSDRSLITHEDHDFDICSDSLSYLGYKSEDIFGNRPRSGPFAIRFLENVECGVVCRKKYVGSNEESDRRLMNLIKGIQMGYQQHWIIDQLPVMWCYEFIDGNGFDYCSDGIPLGDFTTAFNHGNVSYYPYNHLHLEIIYRGAEEEDCGTILAVKIKAKSINQAYSYEPNCQDTNSLTISAFPLGKYASLNIVYTYGVKFVQSNDTKWSRWDGLVQHSNHSNIQWFSIYISLGIVFLLSGLVAKLLIYIAKYNRLEKVSEKDLQESYSWTLIKGDVYRPPSNPQLLCAFVGGGVQILITAVLTLILACLAFSSPEYRAAVLYFAIVSYALLGTTAGYVSARLYKRFGGIQWGKNALLTSLVCPGVVLSLHFAMDLVHRLNQSSGAVSVGSIIYLLVLWLCVSLPLTFLGACLGFYKNEPDPTLFIDPVPSEIPHQTCLTRPTFSILLGGILPFVCIFVQLFFIQNALWTTQYYEMSGFLFATFILLAITCAETAILLCFLHLRARDYQWWWRSFFTSGCVGFYMFIYCCNYFVTKLNIEDISSTILYFGYIIIMMVTFFWLTGTIGFIACLWFIRKIYSGGDMKGNHYDDNLPIVIHFPEKIKENSDA